MGEQRVLPRRRPAVSSPGMSPSAWIVWALQSSAFVLMLHYSRTMPPAGGKRYLPSTAVFLTEVLKLAVSLTMALYEVSKTAPPSMPATSLFFSLTSAVFSGDSWKLAIPAGLYTLANSLQYVGLSNLPAASFQVTYQLKLVLSAVFGLLLLRKTTPARNWGFLLLLVLGIGLLQMPDGSAKDATTALEEETAHIAFPRSLEEWRAAKAGGNIYKRSATYEGIEEDLLTAFPRMNGALGLLAAVGACAASALAGVYFEKVLKDSAKATSPWVRNVQLAVYSLFPALFIGVIFVDGEKVSAGGFFQGYNWAVWLTILMQALGGIMASFFIFYATTATKCLAATASILLSTVGSIWLFQFEITTRFLFGTAAVLAGTYLYGEPTTGYYFYWQSKTASGRPPPIRVDSYEKEVKGETSPLTPSPQEVSIKLPATPFLSSAAGLSSSRPTSPGQTRVPSGSRNVSGTGASAGGYFDHTSHDS